MLLAWCAARGSSVGIFMSDTSSRWAPDRIASEPRAAPRVGTIPADRPDDRDWRHDRTCSDPHRTHGEGTGPAVGTRLVRSRDRAPGAGHRVFEFVRVEGRADDLAE